MKKKMMFTFFAMLLVCATVFASSASVRIYRDAFDDYKEPTIRVRASLQGTISSRDESCFTRVYATIRFDPYDDSVRPPAYTYLNATINVQAHSMAVSSYTTSDAIQIGDYLALEESFSVDDGITILTGQYVAQVIGSSFQFVPDGISMTPYSASEIPDT